MLSIHGPQPPFLSLSALTLLHVPHTLPWVSFPEGFHALSSLAACPKRPSLSLPCSPTANGTASHSAAKGRDLVALHSPSASLINQSFAASPVNFPWLKSLHALSSFYALGWASSVSCLDYYTSLPMPCSHLLNLFYTLPAG